MKPATFDLPRYSVYFETGVAPWLSSTGWKEQGYSEETFDDREYGPYFRNSPGFTYLIKEARKALPHGPYLPRIIQQRHIADSLFLLVVLTSLAILVVALSLLHEKWGAVETRSFSIALLGVIILGSIFFFVGSQNAIRQFWGTSLSILAFALYLRSWFASSTLCLIISFLMHPWSPLFFVLAVMFVHARSVLEKIFRSRALSRYLNEYFIAFALGIACIVAIKLGIKMGIPYFTTYYHIDTAGEGYRSSSTLKLCSFIGLLIVSDLIAGQSKRCGRFCPQALRRCFLIVLAPLVLYPEVFSRLAMFYLAAEMIYLYWAASQKEFRYRASACLVFGVYSFAPNALNILLDKDWVDRLLST